MDSGKKLGRYEVLRHLASGGMADVSIARDGDRYVVVKRIRDDQAKDDRFVNMFIDEARLAASLEHPNIVRTFDIGQEQDEFFFAMEYVHSEDARKLLMRLNKKRERLPLEHVIAIVCGALAGLHHAHEHELQIVHRDVSPANLLVGYDGTVKVADFGIAKAAMRTQETRSGTLKGKVSYMSPEQCTGRPIDRRSDVFAMGIVLYELSTVRRLFKGDNDFMTMTTIVQGNVPKPTTVRPDLPLELEQIIMTALAVMPDKRFSTALEMRGALEAFAAKAKLAPSTAGLAAYMTEVFGIKPLPWLADEEEVIELTVDFDGSASGVAPTTAYDEGQELEDDAPIKRARTIADATGWNADHKEPTTASGTPIAWSPQGQPPAARRRWMIAGIAGVAAAALLLVFVVSRSPSEDDPLPEPPRATHAADPSPPAKDPPKPVIEDPPAPPTQETGSQEAGSQVAAGSGSAKPPKKRPRPRPQPGSASTPKWDPSKLFPDKKK